MLAHEWRELEGLCERISDLRHRYGAAQRTKNVGLLEGLKTDLARTRHQREMLVHHISARLSSVAADDGPGSGAADDFPAISGEAIVHEDASVTTFGFSDG